MGEPFLAQFARPGEATAVNLRALTPFQRALLVIDGTVTKFIEAYTLEPVEIVRLEETHGRSTEEDRLLETPRGTEIAHREVIIQGKYSQTLYVYAVSRIVLERLPEQVRERLEFQGEGLGRLLNEAQIETRREVLCYTRERALDLPPAVQRLADGEFITRSYRIIAQRRPLALITERFPCASGSWLSHE